MGGIAVQTGSGLQGASRHLSIEQRRKKALTCFTDYFP